MVCKNLILLTIGCIILASCASQIMQGYVGKDINEAILDYGQPANIIDLGDGKRAFQWAMGNTTITPGMTFNNGQVNALGNTANVSITSYTTPTVINNDTCLYVLIAEQRNNHWMVTNYRKPRFDCE